VFRLKNHLCFAVVLVQISSRKVSILRFVDLLSSSKQVRYRTSKYATTVSFHTLSCSLFSHRGLRRCTDGLIASLDKTYMNTEKDHNDV